MGVNSYRGGRVWNTVGGASLLRPPLVACTEPCEKAMCSTLEEAGTLDGLFGEDIDAISKGVPPTFTGRWTGCRTKGIRSRS